MHYETKCDVKYDQTFELMIPPKQMPEWTIPFSLIMEICKVPILQLKVLNEPNTHNVHQNGECCPPANI